jgi:hypothetical protein
MHGWVFQILLQNIKSDIETRVLTGIHRHIKYANKIAVRLEDPRYYTAHKHSEGLTPTAGGHIVKDFMLSSSHVNAALKVKMHK